MAGKLIGKFFLFLLALLGALLAVIFVPLASPLFAQGEKDYMAISKDDFINGAVKIDMDFDSGAYDGAFGVFVSANRVVTGALDATLGYPKDIRLKLKDGDLLVCVAKAELVHSDESLALLKITHYTDDLCNYSSPKLYHKELINAQIVGQIKARPIAQSSPFLLKNASRTLRLEQGFPYFDESGRFAGISSGGKVINAERVYRFAKRG